MALVDSSANPLLPSPLYVEVTGETLTPVELKIPRFKDVPLMVEQVGTVEVALSTDVAPMQKASCS
jgi:hypothetical protein